MKSPKRVLLTRYSALGDVAMTIPVVYDAALSNPDVEFLFLTRKHPAKLFVNAPKNLTIRGIDTADYDGIAGAMRLAKELKTGFAPDMMLDLHDVLRTKLLRLFLRLKGVKVFKINKGRRGKRALTRRRNKVLLPLASTPDRYRQVVHHSGLHSEEHFKSIFGQQKPSLQQLAPSIPSKPKGEKWLAIAPFAKHRGKIYPLELMRQVVANYARRPDVRVFLMGAGEEEEKVLQEWAKMSGNIVNMAALKLGIDKELVLLSHCDTMLSMDSANMHMASLVGLRVVSIWGATHPYCGFMGWRQKREDAVQLDMVCRPCSVFGNKPCHRGDYQCLQGITPSRIIDTIAI